MGVIPGGFLDLWDPNRMPYILASSSVWTDWCAANKHEEICILYIDSYYSYRINIAANASFLALFCLSLIGFLVACSVTRRAIIFNLALATGCICELIGYVGRILSWQNQWKMNPFLIQIVCLTIGPAFMAAGVYLCLRRVAEIYGDQNSLVPPPWYTRFFIPCDLLALILQAVGGAWAAIAVSDSANVNPGTHIMVAGLSVQVFTGFAFLVAYIHFMYRIRTPVSLNEAKDAVAIRASRKFFYFKWAVGFAALMIVWRSAFRVAELSRGWDGPVTKKQGLFIGFEGVLIVMACIALNVANPSWCVGERMDGSGGLLARFSCKKKTLAPEGRQPTKESLGSSADSSTL